MGSANPEACAEGQSPTPGRAPGAMESGNFFYSKSSMVAEPHGNGSFNPLSRGIFFIASDPKNHIIGLCLSFNPLSRGIFFIARITTRS